MIILKLRISPTSPTSTTISTIMQNKKVKRNDKCPCSSGKKYKQCCLEKNESDKIDNKIKMDQMHEDGHELTDEVMPMYEYYTKEYPNFKVIDVTNILTSTSYRPIQTKHYERNTIMLATRTADNNQVFETRGDGSTDWIVMFRGAHQVFNQYGFNNIKPQIKNMIEQRLKGEDYVY